MKKDVSYTHRDTLCWACAKATGLCPWSHHGEPIEGWEAIYSPIMYVGNPEESYFVTKCPLYENDGYTERIEGDKPPTRRPLVVNINMEMVKMAEEGCPVHQIARTLGVTLSSVKEHLRSARIKGLYTPIPTENQIDLEVVRLIKETGFGAKKIAKMIGRSDFYVRKHRDRAKEKGLL